MKTLSSSSYNPDWLQYNGALLNMPLPTIILKTAVVRTLLLKDKLWLNQAQKL